MVAEEAVVGDGDLVGVASEILDGFLGTAEGLLGVDDPVLLASGGEMALELLFVVEVGELAVEGELGLGELCEEEAAEQTRENTDAEEEVVAAVGPALAVCSDAAAGGDTVDMGMMQQILTQVWRMEKKPMLAPRWLGSRAMVSRAWALASNRML
jgi:hypothetical protein